MDYIYLNDLVDEYPGKTLLEISDFLVASGVRRQLIKIKDKCRVCGCEVIVTPGLYRKQKTFACDEHMPYRPKGKESRFYNRVELNCSYCGKPIEVTPYEANKKNSFGESHHFCCQECYWKFRSEYYIGEKGTMYQHEYTEEQLQNLSKGVVKRLQKTNRTDTSIQLSVNNILDDLGVKYTREYPLDYYSCDNFLIDYDLIIEVMGDYWHGNPLRYNEDAYLMNQIQSKTILKDKQKRTYIKNHYGYKILNLWESDIKKYLDKCKALIQAFISQQGVLDNYHSFNYSYDDETLKLNSELIVAYQEMSSDQYAHLIKKIS